MTEPKNERAVCLGAVRFLERRRGERIQISSEPDRVERQQQAVEMVAVSDSARFVIEHTRVESFESQIADGKRFSDLIGSLEHSLVPSLPLGTYEIIVPSLGAQSVPGRQAEAVRAAIGAWVVETAAGALKLGPDGDFVETGRVDGGVSPRSPPACRLR